MKVFIFFSLIIITETVMVKAALTEVVTHIDTFILRG